MNNYVTQNKCFNVVAEHQEDTDSMTAKSRRFSSFPQRLKANVYCHSAMTVMVKHNHISLGANFTLNLELWHLSQHTQDIAQHYHTFMYVCIYIYIYIYILYIYIYIKQYLLRYYTTYLTSKIYNWSTIKHYNNLCITHTSVFIYNIILCVYLLCG